MSAKHRKYKDCLTFLEEDDRGYFGSIYFGPAQMDITDFKKTPEEVWAESQELIDKLVGK